MLQINFKPFPTLETDRLVLRQLTIQDAGTLFQLRADPDIMRYIHRPLATSVENVIQLIHVLNEGIRHNECITWAIVLKDTPGIIGTIGYVRMAKEHHRAEIGYLLSLNHRGQGIMQEALLAVVDYGFQAMKLHSIEAIIHPANKASAQVLERSGFVQEGYFKESRFYEGHFHDIVYYSLLTPFTDPTTSLL